MSAFEDEPYDEGKIQWKIEQVKKGISLLPDSYRVVLTLHLLEGFDYDEISEILNIKEATARGQYARARQKLIQILKQNDILCA